MMKIEIMGKTEMEEIILKPDQKGRIVLGSLAKGVSSYKVNIGENGTLTLNPYTEIPLSEKWIFENKELLEKVMKQLKQEDAIPTS